MVDLDGEITINYSDIFEDLKIVELDNGSDVLVAQVNDLLVTKDRIIILDNKLSESVHFFDSNGDFINSIKADSSPEVFTYPGNFVLIKEGKELMVSDAKSSFTYYYDLDGNYLRQVNTKGFGISSVVNIGEEICAISPYQDDWSKKIEIRESHDLSFKRFVDIEDELEFKLLEGKALSVFGNSHNTTIYFTENYNPKISELDKGQIKNSYFFEFSHSNFDYEKGKSYQMIDVYQTIRKKNLNALTGNLIAIDKYIFADFIFSGDQYNRTFLFDTKSNESYVLEGLINDMDIVMKNRRNLYSYPVRNKRLAYAYHPSDIANALASYDGKTANEYTEKIQSLDLKNDNNPVLFIYKLKDGLQLDLE